MASGDSIFKTHFILIVLVFHALVVIGGVTWVFLEKRACIQDATAIRARDIARCRADAERHLNDFISRIKSEKLSEPVTEKLERMLAQSVWREGFGEQGFLFLFFSKSGHLAGRWRGKPQFAPITEFCDKSGFPFLKSPCRQCLETGRPRWVENMRTGWVPGHEKWSFYLFPLASRGQVAGAALDMAETTRTADAYMELSRKHIRHFAVGMVLFLLAMLLATLGVAFLLARRVSREIKNYAESLKKALADGTLLEQGKNQLREFKKLSETTNELLKQSKVAKEERQLTEAQYRKLFETNAVSIWVEDFSAVRAMLDELKSAGITDPEAYFRNHPGFVRKAVGAIRILDVNQETVRLYGADSKERLLSSLEALVSDDSYRGFAFLLAGLFRGEHLICYEEVNRTLKGEEIFVLITVTVEESEDFSRLIVSLVDITDRKKAEEALAEEKGRLSATIHSIKDGILVTDSAGRVIMINPSAQRMTEFFSSDVLGYPLEQIYRVITVGNGHGMDETTRLFFKDEDVELAREEKILVSENGSRYLIDESRAPIVDENEKFRGMVIVFRDITELRRSQTRFARVKRLESLGLMAAGIAHDFNNIMTAVFGNISLARMLSDPDSKVAEKLGIAEQAIERARELTGRLITFSRGGAPVGKQVNLSGLILNTVKKTVGKTGTHWTTDISDALWPVELDVSQFVHVVGNVVKNALEAMDGGGELKIRVENARIGKDDPTVKPGCYVRLIFSDTGHGISKENLDRIFDPYFTTREGAQGLGLSISYGIVKRHDGHIRVESEPGTGSSFEVLLPAVTNEE
ncbi:MAG: PAS domain S-box protein [Acidobacteria bacterium]|nr:PAS domain S-box protein [Acidobacteriota bacterium]